MSNEKACVRARGSALLPDFAAQDRGIKKMIGRTYEEVSPGQFGWKATGKSEEVARSAEIATAIADGDLFPGDAATAAWAAALTRKKVTFDPSFGTEPAAPATAPTTGAPAAPAAGESAEPTPAPASAEGDAPALPSQPEEAGSLVSHSDDEEKSR